MTTMKAVRIRSFGGPEVLELTDIEKPTPTDDEVLIRVRARAGARWPYRWAEAPLRRGIPGSTGPVQAAVPQGEKAMGPGNFFMPLALQYREC